MGEPSTKASMNDNKRFFVLLSRRFDKAQCHHFFLKNSFKICLAYGIEYDEHDKTKSKQREARQSQLKSFVASLRFW